MSDFTTLRFRDDQTTRGYAAAIGFFDGIHLGHRYVLTQLQQLAAEAQLDTMVITFDAHPRRVLGHANAPQLLSSPTEKEQLLRQTGIDACTMLHFSKEMAQRSAEEFMRSTLATDLNVRLLLVGYDNRFGRPQAGEGFADYQRYGAACGIRVVGIPPHGFTPQPQLKLSSSSIRLLLDQGNVDLAAQLLGYRYRLSGIVVQGRQNGRKLGFPTANLALEHPEKLLPHLGVYATRTFVDGTPYPSMTNIGRRPTLNNGLDITVETHLFDFQGNLYGQPITIEFVDRIRDEIRFNGLDALMAQLANDARSAQERLSLHQ